MSDKVNTSFTSKSGKQFTVQYGNDWYEEHDTRQYIVWRVLLNSVPKYVIENNARAVDHDGKLLHNPDYKQSQNAFDTLKIAMRDAKFGPCIEIQCMVRIGDGGMREHTTRLLTKYQALYIASRLSPSHAHLVLSHFYNSLTDEERAMHAADFLQMIDQKASLTMDIAARAESVSEASSRLKCILSLEEAIENQLVEEAAFEEYSASLQLSTELATQQVIDIQTQMDNKTGPVELVDYTSDRLSAAVSVRDAMVALLDSNAFPPLNEAKERITKLRELLPLANSALEIIGILADKVKDPSEQSQMRVLSERPFRDVSFTIKMGPERQLKILYWVEQKKISARDPKEPGCCRPDFLAYGIYALMLDRMGRTSDYWELHNAYKKQYGYTNKQMAYILTTMESILLVPRRPPGLLIVEQRNVHSYGVYCIVNQ